MNINNCVKCNINPKHLKLAYCKECNKIYMKQYKSKDSSKLKKIEYDKKYYNKNKEKIIEINNKWKENNIEKFYEINKEWAINNPDKIKTHQKNYRINNPNYKIRNLWHNLKKKNFSIDIENKNIFNNIKNHIESQFINDMNWTNTEIDHKIPVSWFTNLTPASIINDLRNLQPLYIKDNRNKLASYCSPINIDFYEIIKEYIKHERIEFIK